MRILVLTDLFPPVAFGGYELECAALVGRLRERHDVLVLTSDLDARSVPAEAGVRRELPFAGGPRVRAMLRTPWAAVRAARVTRAVLGEFRPDLVYVSNGMNLPQVATAIAATGGAAVVCRFSELHTTRLFLHGDRFIRSLAPGGRGPRAAFGVVARAVNRHPALRVPARPRIEASVSWAGAALREEAGMPEAVVPVRERVIHPATSRDAVFRAVERRPVDPPVIAYIGRVTDAKGGPIAVEAVARLRSDHAIGARLVLAGAVAPEMERRLRRLAAERGLDGRVEVAGMLSAERLAGLLAEASAVLMPTVEFEAFGLVALEAALARVPVVASRLGGIGEALAHEEHALLVAPGDADALAAALARTLRDADETSERVERARRRAEQFSLPAYLDESEAFLADATT